MPDNDPSDLRTEEPDKRFQSHLQYANPVRFLDSAIKTDSRRVAQEGALQDPH
jgi:hypothetical protein